MTVVLETTIKRYIGDTADTKPTSVPAGSTYYDRQTGILYITYDGTNYVVKEAHQYDDTDKLAVSLYGKGAAAGDVAVDVDADGHLQADVLTIAAGDNNIGNVDVLSIAAGDNNIGNVDIVTLPGTVAADITSIKTAAEIIDNAISGNEMQVDVVGALPAGTASIGGTTDQGAGWTTVFGVGGVRFTSADQSAAAAAVTDAPTGGQKLVITDVVIFADTAMRVDLSIETAGTILMSIYLGANGSAQITTRGKWKLATADKKLMVQTSVAGNVSVSALYYSEA